MCRLHHHIFVSLRDHLSITGDARLHGPDEDGPRAEGGHGAGEHPRRSGGIDAVLEEGVRSADTGVCRGDRGGVQEGRHARQHYERKGTTAVLMLMLIIGQYKGLRSAWYGIDF